MAGHVGMTSPGPLRVVEGEITGERAGAMARAVEALEAALRCLAEAPGPDALAHARDRLWCVVVQREAIGVRRHEVLFEVLRVPAAVRLGMAPRLSRPAAAPGRAIPPLFEP